MQEVEYQEDPDQEAATANPKHLSLVGAPIVDAVAEQPPTQPEQLPHDLMATIGHKMEELRSGEEPQFPAAA
jgi:hypothetical protein